MAVILGEKHLISGKSTKRPEMQTFTQSIWNEQRILVQNCSMAKSVDVWKKNIYKSWTTISIFDQRDRLLLKRSSRQMVGYRLQAALITAPQNDVGPARSRDCVLWSWEPCIWHYVISQSSVSRVEKDTTPDHVQSLMTHCKFRI